MHYVGFLMLWLNILTVLFCYFICYVYIAVLKQTFLTTIYIIKRTYSAESVVVLMRNKCHKNVQVYLTQNQLINYDAWSLRLS